MDGCMYGWRETDSLGLIRSNPFVIIRYVWMDGWVDGWVRIGLIRSNPFVIIRYVCMDGWMDG